MRTLYSQSTGCTYLEGLHAQMPEDAVQITQERLLSVLGSPEPGKVRGHDESGLPILMDPPPAMLENAERNWRDSEIERVQWLRERHRDQLEMDQQPTLMPEQFSELLTYLRNLRDWPQSPDFPSKDGRPATPAWIVEQAQ
jgi:hypothetical protein